MPDLLLVKDGASVPLKRSFLFLAPVFPLLHNCAVLQSADSLEGTHTVNYHEVTRGKRKRIGSAQGCGHRLSGTIQGRSNPDVHPQDTGQTSQNKSTGWRTGELQGVVDELHMELWDKNQDKWKEKTKGRNVCAACWCLSRKGTTDRKTYPDLHVCECSQWKQ